MILGAHSIRFNQVKKQFEIFLLFPSNMQREDRKKEGESKFKY